MGLALGVCGLGLWGFGFGGIAGVQSCVYLLQHGYGPSLAYVRYGKGATLHDAC